MNKKKIIVTLGFLLCSTIGTACSSQSSKKEDRPYQLFIENTNRTNQLLVKENTEAPKAASTFQSMYPSNSAIQASTRLIDYPRFMDATGFITTFMKKPVKVAALFSSYAQAWELAGGSVSITVQESLDRHLLEEENVAVVGHGSGKEINFERLLSYEPDLVILTADYAAHVELADTLRLYDIPTLVLRVDNFIDYLKMLNIFTTILDTRPRYEQYGEQVLDRIDSILTKTDAMAKSPSVLFLRAYSYGAKVKSTNHFVGQMLNDLGAHNIVEDYDVQLDQLSPETLLTSKIDMIFISIMGEDEVAARNYVEQELFTQPAYRNLDAVKNKRYYILPKEYFSFKPNNEWDKAYAYLAKLLYPDIDFSDAAE